MEFPVMSIILMMILAVGMFYGQAQYKKKRAEWGKTLTIFCGIFIIITALWTNLCRSPIDTDAIDREREYQRVQAIVLSQSLLNMYNGKSGKCLIIHHPVSSRSRGDVDRLVEAFKEGLGEAFSEVRPAPIKDIDMDAELIPEEAMMEMTAEDFNNVIKRNSDCDMVITMVPLPFSEDEIYAMKIFSMIEDPDNPGFWIKDPKQKYPLLGIYNGYVGNLEPLFQEKLIGAMTLWRPNPTIDEKDVPDDLMEAFNKRYITITPSTMDAVKSKYPNLFPKPKKK
ncbi:MAG: hypothetical protein NE327_22215 [Lentisphaeraceae bacterium]|nr:hypothetical protein [Lentisphaeraceae bacterium]